MYLLKTEITLQIIKIINQRELCNCYILNGLASSRKLFLNKIYQIIKKKRRKEKKKMIMNISIYDNYKTIYNIYPYYKKNI